MTSFDMRSLIRGADRATWSSSIHRGRSMLFSVKAASLTPLSSLSVMCTAGHVLFPVQHQSRNHDHRNRDDNQPNPAEPLRILCYDHLLFVSFAARLVLMQAPFYQKAGLHGRGKAPGSVMAVP